jgi:hypothetical protein
LNDNTTITSLVLGTLERVWATWPLARLYRSREEYEKQLETTMVHGAAPIGLYLQQLEATIAVLNKIIADKERDNDTFAP